MAVLRKRGRKYYIDMYVDGNRKVIALSTGNKVDAELILKKVESDIVLGRFDLKNYSRKDILLEDFFLKYFDSVEPLKKGSTIRNEQHYAKQFVVFVGNRKLKEIDIELLDGWKAEILKTYSPVTFNIRRRFLHAAMNAAVRWEYLTANPFSRIKKVKVEERRLFLTIDELTKVFEIIDGDIINPDKKWNRVQNVKFRQLLEFLVLTGMRRQEALSLRWENINLTEERIMLEKTKGKTSRTIPMHPAVKQIIIDLGDSLFSSLKPATVSHKFKSICNRAGLPDGFKLHSLRHTFATRLNDSGTNIAAVQELLGHADIRTTLIYSKMTPELMKKEVLKLQSPTPRAQEPPIGYKLVTTSIENGRIFRNVG